MKTAVSIPDPTFAAADGLARSMGITRSKLYTRALEAFVARHRPSNLTEAMNVAVDAAGQSHDDFTKQGAKRIFERSEW